MPLTKDLYRMSTKDWSEWRWAFCFLCLFLRHWELVIVTYNVWNIWPESIFQVTRGQRDTQ